MVASGPVVVPAAGVAAGGVASAPVMLQAGQRLRIRKASFAQVIDAQAGAGSGKLRCDGINFGLLDSNGLQVATYAADSFGDSILGTSSGAVVFVLADEFVEVQDYNGLGGSLGNFRLIASADLRNDDLANPFNAFLSLTALAEIEG